MDSSSTQDSHSGETWQVFLQQTTDAMFGHIPFALCLVAIFWISRTVLSLRRNIAIAKATGLPYVISPIDGIAGYFWTAIHDPILALLKKIPYCRDRLWHIILEPHRGWHYAQEMREHFGEAFLIASPGQIYINISNPAAIMQITTRRNDFLKPIEMYGIVDIFGVSMLSSEGDNWKRHRKIVAPAFSEKSNALVWKESLKQGAGMLDFWSKKSGNSLGNIKVKDTAPDTALMALHVISGAGFGVRQVWDDEDENLLGEKAIPGFNTKKLKDNHRLAFKDSLNTLLHGIIWMAIFPIWLLNMLPFDVHKKLMQSYYECADYFKELSEYKVEQLARGEKAEEGTMDLMGPLIKASENNPDESNGQYMTKQDVIANSWIFLFAGHETTANTLHFAFLFLATSLDTQAHLQRDIDTIVGTRPSETWTYETDLGRLYNSLVGATMNETLRIMQPIIDIPKVVKNAPQPLSISGTTYTIPTNAVIHLNTVSVHRSPKYWPHNPSKISKKFHDLDDFVPERWLGSSAPNPVEKLDPRAESDSDSDHNREKRPASPTSQLYTPPKGAFLPFSEGARACPGRRFTQVEITAVLAVIFQTHSVELDVAEWASDEEVRRMGRGERIAVYETAKARARKLMRESESIITLQMLGTNMPVRFVRRGEERFLGCYVGY